LIVEDFNMKIAVIPAASLVFCSIAAAPAYAVDFSINWATNSPAASISQVDSAGVVAPNGTYLAGPLQVTGLTGAPAYVPTSFISYCVELTQTTGLGSLTGYSIKPNGTTLAEVQPPSSGQPVGPAKLELIGKLVTQADSTWGIVKTTAQGAAVQAAIWEIVYETAATFKLFGSGAGNFIWDGSSATDVAMTTIDGWWATLDSQSSNYQFGVLHKAGNANLVGQDFLVPVPEPEAYGLALAGMGVVAFAMRRRRGAGKQD
jgi:hypothetical protein